MYKARYPSKNNKTVKVMIGSNVNVLANMQAGNFNDIVWASDNLETVAHYYEGCVIQLEISLDTEIEQDYLPYYESLEEIKGYTWGKAKMICPKNAIWYSFSRQYLINHLKSVKEIKPNLSRYFEES